mmetsp:Transcript_15890/g.50763  ORF Transcript_15890/g.50763 Transcript_15890/m.50763 type:complete len:206 (+) Transcript_15890:270-887(+)
MRSWRRGPFPRVAARERRSGGGAAAAHPLRRRHAPPPKRLAVGCGEVAPLAELGPVLRVLARLRGARERLARLVGPGEAPPQRRWIDALLGARRTDRGRVAPRVAARERRLGRRRVARVAAVGHRRDGGGAADGAWRRPRPVPAAAAALQTALAQTLNQKGKREDDGDRGDDEEDDLVRRERCVAKVGGALEEASLAHWQVARPG